jgi:hypothetical protein
MLARNYKEADDETRRFVNEAAERLALYCDDLEAAEGRKWRTRLEKEADKETGGGAFGGDVSQLISRAAVSSTNINSRRRTRTGSSQLRLRLGRRWAQQGMLGARVMPISIGCVRFISPHLPKCYSRGPSIILSLLLLCPFLTTQR